MAGVVEWAEECLGRSPKCQCPGVITGLRGSGWEGNIRGH